MADFGAFVGSVALSDAACPTRSQYRRSYSLRFSGFSLYHFRLYAFRASLALSVNIYIILSVKIYDVFCIFIVSQIQRNVKIQRICVVFHVSAVLYVKVQVDLNTK